MSAAVASATLYNDDSASPMTMNKPVGTATGDLLVAVVVDDSGAIGDLTAATGFTASGTVVNGAGQFAKVFSRVVDGTEASTFDFGYNAGGAAAGVMYRITGADTTPTVLVASNYVNSNLSTFDANTLTPSGTDDLEIIILTNSCGGSTLSYAVPSASPSYTDRGKTQASTTFQGLAAADRQLNSASATGAQTWGSISPVGKQAGSFNVLIKSAAAGGGAVVPYAAPYAGIAPGRISPTGQWQPQMYPTTLFSQALAGTLTSSGALTKQANKALAGTATSSGALTKQANKALAGTITSSGSLAKLVAKALAGTMTSSGTLANAKVILLSLGGTTSSSGALTKQANKALAGTLTSSGALAKADAKALAGTLTSSGAIGKQTGKTLAGTLTSTGALTKLVGKTLAGTLTSVGALAKLVAKALAGTLTSTGALTTSGGASTPARDLKLDLAAPETKWRTGPPGSRWAAGAPDTKWHTGPPEVR